MQEDSSRRVVSAVVSLAKAFSLQTMPRARRMNPPRSCSGKPGVDFLQGYVIARPRPAAEVLLGPFT